jgi:hypothetical protein
VERHFEGIPGHWRGRLTSALMEGLNPVFSVLKRKARGFRCAENLISMLCFHSPPLSTFPLRAANLFLPVPPSIENIEEPIRPSGLMRGGSGRLDRLYHFLLPAATTPSLSLLPPCLLYRRERFFIWRPSSAGIAQIIGILKITHFLLVLHQIQVSNIIFKILDFLNLSLFILFISRS